MLKKKTLKKTIKKTIKKVLKKGGSFTGQRKKIKRKKFKSGPKPQRPQIFKGLKKAKIRIIGIGGGAGSIISELVSKVKKADFVVANTDSRALKTIKKAKRFQFGQNLTQGLGTGMNVELGAIAAEEAKDKIKHLFEGYDFCIIIACLGGGTSSGAAPIFAKFSKGTGCQTYGIFTLPFNFEGEKKMEIAQEALLKTKSHLNVFSVMPNESIFQSIDKNTPLREALSVVNKRLAENLEGLIEMIYLPGLINIDFADLKTILSGRGRLAYLNSLEIGEGELDKEEVLKKIISTPLYPYTIRGARDILYNVVGGKNLQLSRVSQISKYISELVNKNAKIIFGISQDKSYQDRIKIILLATGCGITNPKPKPTTKPKPKLQPQPQSKPQPTADQPKAGKPKPKKVVKRAKLPAKSGEISSFQIPKPVQDSPEKNRRNALQVKKAIEQEEKELLEKEKIWETPAVLRKNHGN